MDKSVNLTEPIIDISEKSGSPINTYRQAFQKPTALLLSGGGFRATLYHLGSLWRLYDANYLTNIDIICSVSGGSILAAYLGLHLSDLSMPQSWFGESNKPMWDHYQKNIAEPIREFCSKSIDLRAILSGVFKPKNWFRPGENLLAAYEKHLFRNIKLWSLPEHPDIRILASNLETGQVFTFSRLRVGDPSIGYTDWPDYRLAEAVAASSAFPPFFSPVILPMRREFIPDDKRQSRIPHSRFLYLSDGGVIDNLAIHNMLFEAKTIFVSDGGKRFRPGRFNKIEKTWIGQTLKAHALANNQADPLRRRYLAELIHRNELSGAIWSIHDRPASDQIAYDSQLPDKLGAIRTRLNHFSDVEQERLINWGYFTTAQWITHDFKTGQPVPFRWPYKQPMRALWSGHDDFYERDTISRVKGKT